MSALVVLQDLQNHQLAENTAVLTDLILLSSIQCLHQRLDALLEHMMIFLYYRKILRKLNSNYKIFYLEQIHHFLEQTRQKCSIQELDYEGLLKDISSMLLSL